MAEWQQISVNIEFLRQQYKLIIPYNPEVNLQEIRETIKNELQNSIQKQKSRYQLRLPSEIITQILTSSIPDYLTDLLIDRICAVLAVSKQYDTILGNPPYLRLQSIQPIWKRSYYTTYFHSGLGILIYIIYLSNWEFK